MKIVYTKHALEKLNSSNAKSLKITKSKIESALRNPVTTDTSINPHRKTGLLNENLSLGVIYRPD